MSGPSGESETKNSGMVYGMVLGMLAGISIWSLALLFRGTPALPYLGVFIGIGMCLGTSIGCLFDYRAEKKPKDGHN